MIDRIADLSICRRAQEISSTLLEKSLLSTRYSQVLNNHPHHLLILKFFLTPWALLGPLFINFKESEIFYELFLFLLSLFVLFRPTFQSKTAYFSVYCNFMLYDNLFLYFCVTL